MEKEDDAAVVHESPLAGVLNTNLVTDTPGEAKETPTTDTSETKGADATLSVTPGTSTSPPPSGTPGKAPLHSSPTTPFGSSFRRPDLDGLRCLAVAAVIIYHTDETWLPGGFVGVDIFFMISGYVVSASLLRKPSATIREYLTSFYARRFKRLAPSLLLMVTVTGLMLAMLMPSNHPSLSECFSSGLLALVGGSNIFFVIVAPSPPTFHSNNPEDILGGYFGRRLEDAPAPPSQSPQPFAPPAPPPAPPLDIPHDLQINPFMHTWSLGVEEQFYFVFPLLMLWAYRERVVLGRERRTAKIRPVSTWPTPKSMGPWHQRPSTILGAVAAISVVVSCILSVYHLDLAFHLMPSRLWQMALGAMLLDAHISNDFQSQAGLPFKIPSTVLLLALDVTCLLFFGLAFAYTDARSNLFPLPWSLLAVIGTVSFVTAGALDQQHVQLFKGKVKLQLPLLNAAFSLRPIVWLGKLSYPLYLWHWPVVIAFKLTPAGFEAAGSKFAAAVVSLALAVFSYEVLEKPFRNWHPKRPSFVFMRIVPAILLVAVWMLLLQFPLRGKLHVINATYVHPPPPPPEWCNSGTPEELQLSVEEALTKMRMLESSGSQNSSSLAYLNCGSAVPAGTCDQNDGWIKWQEWATASTTNTENYCVPKRHCSCRRCTESTLPMAPQPLLAPSASTDATCNTTLGDMSLSEKSPCFVNADNKDVGWLGGTSDTGYGVGDAYSAFSAACYDRDPAIVISCLTPGATLTRYPLGGHPIDDKRCIVTPRRGGGNPERMLWLVGDSHAAGYVPALMSALQGEYTVIFSSRGWQQGFNAIFPCDESLGEPFPMEEGVHGANRGGGWAATQLELATVLEHMQEGDMLAIVNSEWRFPKRQYIDAQAVFLREVAAKIGGRGGNMLLVADNPRNDWGRRGMTKVESVFYGWAIHEYMGEMLRKVSEELENVYYIDDTFDKMCPSEPCMPFVPNTLMPAYTDDHHLSTQGALYLAPFVACFFEEHGLL